MKIKFKSNVNKDHLFKNFTLDREYSITDHYGTLVATQDDKGQTVWVSRNAMRKHFKEVK